MIVPNQSRLQCGAIHGPVLLPTTLRMHAGTAGAFDDIDMAVQRLGMPMSRAPEVAMANPADLLRGDWGFDANGST